MSENKMGYRGSKSGIMPVKEQRVDDSWFIKKTKKNNKFKVYSNGRRKLLSSQNPF